MAEDGARPLSGFRPDPKLRRRWFRLFLSHTSAHRVLAGQIRERLYTLGVDTFVAHSAITASEEWQKVIEGSLRSCHAMAALITPDFKSSEYCDQELGFAMARDLLIITIRQGADPHGFLSNRQGIAGDTSPEGGMILADTIYDTLMEKRQTESRMSEVLVYRYVNSSSPEEAERNFLPLLGIRRKHWNQEMLGAIRAAVQKNPHLRARFYSDAGPLEILDQHLREMFGPNVWVEEE